jgi:undecaprenyl-phosphate 4-deoxy-4-formamido-L-arabinose transferase
MEATRSISAVVPVYNSQDSLNTLVDRLGSVLEQVSQDYEVILVNDGSRDASWEVIKKIAQTNPRVRGFSMMRNYGQHNALLAGIRKARKELVVTLDDDLQNPPEEIPRMLKKIEGGYDVVYGYPEHEQHGLWRDLASQMTKIALRSAMGVETARHVSPYRIFNTQIRRAFTEYRSPHLSIDALLSWGSTRFTAIPVRHDARVVGVSNYSFRKLIGHALNMITGFTILPLQLASVIGFGFTLFGCAVFAFVLLRFFLAGGSVPGFPFLASVIAIFSGAQLFALGILGEYLARVHFRLMDRPAYAIRESTPETTLSSQISSTQPLPDEFETTDA